MRNILEDRMIARCFARPSRPNRSFYQRTGRSGNKLSKVAQRCSLWSTRPFTSFASAFWRTVATALRFCPVMMTATVVAFGLVPFLLRQDQARRSSGHSRSWPSAVWSAQPRSPCYWFRWSMVSLKAKEIKPGRRGRALPRQTPSFWTFSPCGHWCDTCSLRGLFGRDAAEKTRFNQCAFYSHREYRSHVRLLDFS
jgi:hypothetical protein